MQNIVEEKAVGDWEHFQDQIVEMEAIGWTEPRCGIFHESAGLVRLTPLAKSSAAEGTLIPALHVLQVKLLDSDVVARLRREAGHS